VRTGTLTLRRPSTGSAGAAAPARAGQLGDHDLQRRCGQRLAPKRRLCGGQGHRQVHQQLRRRRIATGRVGDRLRVGSPAVDPATDLGAKAVAAYAERQGVDVETLRAGHRARTHRGSKSGRPCWRSPVAGGVTTMPIS